MKHTFLSILLIMCAHTAAAAEQAAFGAAPTDSQAALCTTVVMEDDFLTGSAALEALARQACAAKPELCVPDGANREAFLRLNPGLLSENAHITRPALEAFFKGGAQPNQCELYELAYIFDTLLVKRVSDAACSGADSALAKVQRLADWTFEHVALSSALQAKRTATQPVYPFDIIARGHGFDFQIGWALAALAQQQGLAVALAYLPPEEGSGIMRVLVLVFLEEGSVFVDPVHGIVWKDASTQSPIGLRQALEKPGRIQKLHSHYDAAMVESLKKAAFRIPYHPLALLPKMKTVQSVVAETCGVRPVLYVDLTRAHNAFGHLFCRVEGKDSFSYSPELMEFKLPGREYACSVWLLPLVQLFASGLPQAPEYFEGRRMHLRAEYDQASLNYRRVLSYADDPEQRAELTFFLGLLEYDRGDYKKAVFTLQRYLDRYYKSRQDQVRFLLARSYQKLGNREKSAELMKFLRNNPRYELFVPR